MEDAEVAKYVTRMGRGGEGYLWDFSW